MPLYRAARLQCSEICAEGHAVSFERLAFFIKRRKISSRVNGQEKRQQGCRSPNRFVAKLHGMQQV
jgi:hypothetical protein